MPRISNRSAILRQWHMLRALPRKAPGVSVAEVSLRLREAGFPVSKRTVERDLRILEDAMGLSSQKATGRTLWSWFEGVNSSLPGISVSDALSFVMLEDALKTLAPSVAGKALKGHFDQARAKLEAAQGSSISDWHDRVRYLPPTLPFRPPFIPEGTLEKVHDALLNRRALLVRYNPAEKRTGSYLLHPQSLVRFGVTNYLVAVLTSEINVMIAASRVWTAVWIRDENGIR